jgi:hypothetical protein
MKTINILQKTKKTSEHKGKKNNSPPHNNLLRIDFMMQLIHSPMILHINRNLLTCLAMQHRERAPHLYRLSLRPTNPTGTADSEEGTDYAILIIFTAEVVV